MSKIAVHTTLTIALSGLLATPAYAATLDINVEIPKLNVAEYHRPYVAVWIEGADQKVAANLSVWYQQTSNAEGHGTKWLPDMRQWWRKSGRSLQVPVDGVTGPTRPAGKQALSFNDKQPALKALAPGNYTLVVEAVREVGGRELLKIPFTWPVTTAQNGKAQGATELGLVTLTAKPAVSIGGVSAEVVTLQLQPASGARLVVADALAGNRTLAYSLKGTVSATPQEKKQRSFDVDSRSTLNQAPGLPGVLEVTVRFKPVLCGTELSLSQSGIPDMIPLEMCVLGWQESLAQLAHLVEPDIPG